MRRVLKEQIDSEQGMLQWKAGSIEDVTYLVGHDDPVWSGKISFKQIGLLPREYLRLCRRRYYPNKLVG